MSPELARRCTNAQEGPKVEAKRYQACGGRCAVVDSLFRTDDHSRASPCTMSTAITQPSSILRRRLIACLAAVPVVLGWSAAQAQTAVSAAYVGTASDIGLYLAEKKGYRF